MTDNYQDWVTFWGKNKLTTYRESIWRLNMKIFIESTSNLMGYNKNDRILDIGCGPGYLADNLHSVVQEIHCVDICDDFIKKGKDRLKKSNNVYFYKMEDKNYTDLSMVGNHKFNKIICLSVIQYYEKREHLKLLVHQVKRVAQKGAKFLIADIPQGQKRKSELFELVKLSTKNGYFLDLLKYLWMMRFSGYHQTKTKKDILIYKTNYLLNMVNQEALNANLLKEPYTVNKGRLHLLITF